MPDPRGWPNPARLGFPTNPDLEGPHLIEDEHGKRRLMWWLPDTVVWFSSSLQLPPILAGERWTYVGARSCQTSRRLSKSSCTHNPVRGRAQTAPSRPRHPRPDLRPAPGRYSILALMKAFNRSTSACACPRVPVN
jgi:hypothetical protein